MRFTYWLLILTIFFLPSSIYGANQYKVHVEPGSLNPGDIFIVKIKSPLESPVTAEINKRVLAFSSCGADCSYAIGAIDAETPPGVYPLIIRFKHKRPITRHLRVKKFSFPEISIKLPEEMVILSPEDEARAQEEEGLLKSIWTRRTQRIWKGRFIKPVQEDISTQYGVKRIINDKKISIHKGVDFKSFEGQPVMAVNDGRVVLVKELFFGGKTVVIDHGDGLFSVYMHLSEYKVNEGDLVSKGVIIGLAGSTGRATGPHLHFTFKVSDISVNPEVLFNNPVFDEL